MPYFVKIILQIFMQQLVSKNSQCTGQLKVKRSNWSYLKGLQSPEEYNIHAHKKNA